MYTTGDIKCAMHLYAVTDRAWLGGRSLAECVRDAIAGGATFVQLREKHASFDEKQKLAQEIMPICARARVPFVVDDDVELARACGADGVHVGQSDMACAKARAVLGPEKIVGVSVQTLKQALAAERDGASYLGVGAMIATSTKPDAQVVSAQTLAEICASVNIPVVAIGGLNERTLGILENTGVDGVAVVSALFAASDIKQAALTLSTTIGETLR